MPESRAETPAQVLEPAQRAAELARLRKAERVRRAGRAAEAQALAEGQAAEGRELARQTIGRDPAAAMARAERVRAARAERKERAAAAEVEAAEPIPLVRQPGRKWLATLENASGEQRQVNSHWARVGRCQKRIKAWADAIPRMNRRHRRAYEARGIAPRLVMITLTYADDDTEHKKSDGWEPNHIRDFMQKLRKELKGALWAYAWVAEMQERGSLHYHAMVYVAPGTKIPMPDKSGMWPHGGSKIETAKKGPWYILTYVGKEYQKEGLPHGARMFHPWINPKMASKDEIFGFRLSAAPPYVQEAIRAYHEKGVVTSGVRWARVPGGGWVIKDLGEILRSEWFLVGIRAIEPEFETGREMIDDEQAYERFTEWVDRQTVRG